MTTLLVPVLGLGFMLARAGGFILVLIDLWVLLERKQTGVFLSFFTSIRNV